MSCRRFLVLGRVQGVAYRAWTVDQAERLGVTGWARNLADGRVEVVARGSREAVDALRTALSDGPPAARVKSVDEAAIDPSSDPASESAGEHRLSGFSIR